jgi:hypothetical protein
MHLLHSGWWTSRSPSPDHPILKPSVLITGYVLWGVGIEYDTLLVNPNEELSLLNFAQLPAIDT